MIVEETLTGFAPLGVEPDLVDALSDLGIAEAFPIQRLTIPDALAGRDICGKAKTGSGKTLAFGVALIQRLGKAAESGGSAAPRGLVLVPTRELARQVADVLAPLAVARDLNLLACYGGTSLDDQVKALAHGCDVVVATPGRLIDLRQRKEIDLDRVEVVVIDEADRMADMGFTPQVEWLLRHLVGTHQTMLFSATLDSDVDRLVRHELKDPVHHEVASATTTVSEMAHRFIQVHQMDKVKVAAAVCKASSRAIVFTRTKHAADRLTENLRQLQVDARPIHGDLRQKERERALQAFSEGRLAVLVATDVAARGLDVDDIEVVVHFDPPEDHKGYLHRSGRTARAGRAGLAVTLVLWNEQMAVEKIQKRLGLNSPIVEMFSNDPRLSHLATWDPSAI